MSKWQGFYSTSQVSRLAGIPIRILYYWKKRGVLAPSVSIIDAKGNIDEGYSYADLAIIKVLHALKIHKLNLRSAVIAFRHLHDRFGIPSSGGWANAHVYIIGKDVLAQKPDNWDTTIATHGGQKAEMRVLGELVEEEGALLVPRQFSEYIEINPDVMDGEPVIKDTRVPTSMRATLKVEGIKVPKIVEIYSPISAIAIECAIAYEKNIEENYSKVIKATKATKARTSTN